MSEEKPGKEILNRYLLGDLSESEAEAVETRYFADPAYLCEVLAARDDLLDAGLRGELPPLEMQQLSERLQVLSGLRDQAAFAYSLQQALAQPAKENDRSGTATVSEVPKPLATLLITQRKAWFAPPRWAWGAAALLLLTAVWFGLNLVERGRNATSQKVGQSPHPPTPLALPTEIGKQAPDLAAAVTPTHKTGLPAVKQSPTVGKPGASVATFVLSAGLVRTSQDAPELDIAATVKTINLQLELAPPLERPQWALLQNAVGGLVWQQSPLRSQTYNGVRVAICVLPAHVLSEGAYQLRLWQPGGNEAVYYFRLKKL
jgi:hypothetical protein